jgi:hypothetical protein
MVWPHEVRPDLGQFEQVLGVTAARGVDPHLHVQSTHGLGFHGPHCINAAPRTPIGQ